MQVYTLSDAVTTTTAAAPRPARAVRQGDRTLLEQIAGRQIDPMRETVIKAGLLAGAGLVFLLVRR